MRQRHRFLGLGEPSDLPPSRAGVKGPLFARIEEVDPPDPDDVHCAVRGCRQWARRWVRVGDMLVKLCLEHSAYEWRTVEDA